MKAAALVLALAAFVPSAIHAAPPRINLAGFNGIAFGTTFDVAKEQLGGSAISDTDPSDPKIKILLTKINLYGETFSTNYSFAINDRFSALYAVADLPAADHVICQSRWASVLDQLKEKFGVPDDDNNKLSSSVPSQSITFKFADGAVIEAAILGCLLTVDFLSPAEAK